MPLQALDIAALSELLDKHADGAGEQDPADTEGEHPLAQKLRTVLANREEHRLGDLARVIDEILREMSLFRAPGSPEDGREDEPGV